MGHYEDASYLVDAATEALRRATIGQELPPRDALELTTSLAVANGILALVEELRLDREPPADTAPTPVRRTTVQQDWPPPKAASTAIKYVGKHL